MRRLRHSLCAALLALPLLAGVGQAQSGPDAPARTQGPVILTLDQGRLFEGSAFGKAALARDAAANRDLAAENQKIEQALGLEEKDLTARRASLAADEFASLAAAFDARVEQIRTDQDAKSRAITRRRDEDRQRFFQAAVPVLGGMLSESGAVAILDKGAIILSLSVIDVTEDAIARVDAALGDGATLPTIPQKAADPKLAPAPAPAP